MSFSRYCWSKLHPEVTALLYQECDLHFKIFGFSELGHKTLHTRLYPRWCLGALATKFCGVILVIEMPHSCLPAFFPWDFPSLYRCRGTKLILFVSSILPKVCVYLVVNYMEPQPSGQRNTNCELVPSGATARPIISLREIFLWAVDFILS